MGNHPVSFANPKMMAANKMIINKNMTIVGILSKISEMFAQCPTFWLSGEVNTTKTESVIKRIKTMMKGKNIWKKITLLEFFLVFIVVD